MGNSDMSIRATRSNSIALHDTTQQNLNGKKMVRKRTTRRHKENEHNDDEPATAGKFVKYPQETPAKDTTEVEQKSTKTARRKRNALTEINVTTEDIKPDQRETVVEDSTKKRGRQTRSKKNLSIDLSGPLCDNTTEPSVSIKGTKKSTKPKIPSNPDESYDVQQEIKIVDVSDDKKSHRKTKRKVKSKKTKSHATPDKIDLDFVTNIECDVSFKPIESLLVNGNTSTDSFHSAAGSPVKTIDIVDSKIKKLSKFYKPDTTFDKSGANSVSDNSIITENNSFPGKNKSTTEHKSVTPNNPIIQLKKKSSSESVLNSTFDKSPERKSFRISNQDKEKLSEDIFNTSPILIDSSVDVSKTSLNNNSSRSKSDTIVATTEKNKVLNETFDKSVENDKSNKKGKSNSTKKLIREGTFTKEIQQPNMSNVVGSPVRTKKSLPAPGSTPYHSRRKNTRSVEKSTSILNLTKSIEKEKQKLRRSSSVNEVSRQTKVMFCSPVWNGISNTEKKSKIIKSSLKGSNKSFAFEEGTPTKQVVSSRKRSFTHGDAENIAAKRKKLAGEELTSSINRLSRPKTTGTNAKQSEGQIPGTPNCKPPLRMSWSETKPTSVRSKLPNFAALHRKAFNRMESLSECQERKAERARQMLKFTSSGTYSLDGRRNCKAKTTDPKFTTEEKKATINKMNTQPINASYKQPDTKFNGDSKAYTRFGFKLQTDFNPFSIPSAQPKKNNPLDIPTAKQSTKAKIDKYKTTMSNLSKVSGTALNGTIMSLRKEKSKSIITREAISENIIDKKKKENRDIIKGVRTNRRFELQMKSRNMN